MPLWRNNHFSETHCNFVVTKQLRNCLKFYQLESYDPQRVNVGEHKRFRRPKITKSLAKPKLTLLQAFGIFGKAL